MVESGPLLMVLFAASLPLVDSIEEPVDLVVGLPVCVAVASVDVLAGEVTSDAALVLAVEAEVVPTEFEGAALALALSRFGTPPALLPRSVSQTVK